MFIRGSKTFFIIFKRTWTQVNAIFTAWTISWFSIYLEILLLEANSGIKGLETSEQSIRNKCLQRSAHLSALKRYMFHEIDERTSPPSRSKYYYKIPSPRSNVEPFAAHSRIRRIIPYIFLLRILRTFQLLSRGGEMLRRHEEVGVAISIYRRGVEGWGTLLARAMRIDSGSLPSFFPSFLSARGKDRLDHCPLDRNTNTRTHARTYACARQHWYL